MTNDLFDRQRFVAYFRKLMTERWRRFGISTFILLGVLVVVEIWMAIRGYSTDYPYQEDPVASGLMFPVGLVFLAGGCIAASRMFTDGERKGGRIHVLTTPVSTFESWLSRWIIYILAYPLVFLSCFYMADALRVVLFSTIPSVRFFNIFSHEDVSCQAWLTYLFFTSWFVLGSYFFPRRPLLSTGITLFIGGQAFAMMMITQVTDWAEFSDSGEDIAETLLDAWLVGHALFNWWLSYRRLKEMEVIDHH